MYQCKYCSKTASYPHGHLACKRSPTGAHLWEELQTWKAFLALIALLVVLIYLAVLVIGPVQAVTQSLKISGLYPTLIVGAFIFSILWAHKRLIRNNRHLLSSISLWSFVVIEILIAINFTAYLAMQGERVDYPKLLKGGSVFLGGMYDQIIINAVSIWLAVAVMSIILIAVFQVLKKAPIWLMVSLISLFAVIMLYAFFGK